MNLERFIVVGSDVCDGGLGLWRRGVRTSPCQTREPGGWSQPGQDAERAEKQQYLGKQQHRDTTALRGGDRIDEHLRIVTIEGAPISGSSSQSVQSGWWF
jgi:hypothetical protein